MPQPIELDDLECEFKEEVLEKVPDALLDLCMTCGTCSGGCPASGLMDMDPRKLLRMINLGMDEEVKKSKWAWVCTMCARCQHACPMKINIPKMVYNLRGTWPRDRRPKGIRGSCDQHIRTGSAMGVPSEWAVGTLRLSVGRMSREIEVDRAVDADPEQERQHHHVREGEGDRQHQAGQEQIGRASCRERV